MFNINLYEGKKLLLYQRRKTTVKSCQSLFSIPKTTLCDVFCEIWSQIITQKPCFHFSGEIHVHADMDLVYDMENFEGSNFMLMKSFNLFIIDRRRVGNKKNQGIKLAYTSYSGLEMLISWFFWNRTNGKVFVLGVRGMLFKLTSIYLCVEQNKIGRMPAQQWLLGK